MYQKGIFPVEYVPTVFENSSCKITFKKLEYRVQLWDTGGQEELVNVRQLSYPSTDMFLVCFSVVDRDSFQNIKALWAAEINDCMVCPCFLLVGCKTDLRDQVANSVTPIEGREMARLIGAFDYMECSALTRQGVEEVFERAVSCAVARPCGGHCCSVA
jgi:small GTP-binding protein